MNRQQRRTLDKCRELRLNGWVPLALATTVPEGATVELISFPFPSEDGESVLIHARTTPGDATTRQLWILVGEKVRPTDDQTTGLRDLRLKT